MAKRLSGSEKWDKAWFRKLPPKYKCFWEYLRDKCDLVGLWEIDFDSASFHIGEEIEEKEVFIFFKNKISRVDDKILILGFCHFQYGEKLNPRSPIHKKIINLLNKYSLYDTLYNRVVDSVQVKEEVKVKEEEEVKVKEEVKEEIGVLKISKLENELINSFSWKETICRNIVETGIDFNVNKIDEKISQFIKTISGDGEEEKNLKDAKKHFNRWLMIDIKNTKNEQQNSKTKSGASDNYRRKTFERLSGVQP